ncbi:class I SAM-dependent methyltransferase [Phocicoccus pinnipedialis]|uniref:N-6 DNA Methylase n=1 Tax=Phocicoccus pinnipedialis TaxID=110845 RepID=A0A6V7RE34_9BACL|nr:class I SAM-dependent methyltransferase [Jeotgalicoccus pinnipedialis]MBP1939509.1 site-specific DNA-methyltransferase (adenine-specific) [Jeotgalicoccus pinnipedialis]CAD2075090.1 N-6 DNA Methylase [Jeotgalicoccus pinnipedialis]
MDESNLEKIYATLISRVEDLIKAEDISRLEALSRALIEVDVEGSRSEKRKAFQFAYLKQIQDEPVQSNHQLTPDMIGIIVGYIIDLLSDKQARSVIDVGSGTGHLSFTLKEVNEEIELTGVEVDPTLVEMNANLCEFLETEMMIHLENIIEPGFIQMHDAAVGDLPIGYYPLEVKGYKTAFKEGQSFAHLLMLEAAMNYVEEGALGVFIVPSSILTEKADTFKTYITEDVTMQMFLNLPKSIFKSKDAAKSIIVLRKGYSPLKNKEVLIGDIPDFKDQHGMTSFLRKLDEWHNR